MILLIHTLVHSCSCSFMLLFIHDLVHSWSCSFMVLFIHGLWSCSVVSLFSCDLVHSWSHGVVILCSNSSRSPGRRLASSSASRPAALRQSDPRAFFNLESDRGLGHAPGHGLAVPRQGTCPAPCPGHHTHGYDKVWNRAVAGSRNSGHLPNSGVFRK